MLSTQAIILSVVLGILTVVAAVATFMNYTDESLAGLITWVILFAVVIYDTECLSIGPCTTWSWIRTILWSIIPVFMIVIIITAIVKTKKRMDMRAMRMEDGDADS